METWFERVVICRAETYSTQRYYRKSRHSRAHSVLLPKVRLLDRRETETQGEGAKKNGVGEKRSTGHWRAYFPTLAILFCFVLYTPSVMTSFPRFSFLLFTFFSRFVAPPLVLFRPFVYRLVRVFFVFTSVCFGCCFFFSFSVLLLLFLNKQGACVPFILVSLGRSDGVTRAKRVSWPIYGIGGV